MGKTIAIVGASADRAKYGNKAVRAFIQGGWTVYPVNPSVEEVEGLQSYASVADVPGPIDCISMYVPPNIGRKMLVAVAEKLPKEFYLNPGSESVDLVRDAEAIGLHPIQACSIVNIGLHPDMFPDKLFLFFWVDDYPAGTRRIKRARAPFPFLLLIALLR